MTASSDAESAHTGSDRIRLLRDRFGSGLEGVSGVGRKRYRYPDTAAKLWIFSSVFWFVVVTTFGMIIAIELANPEVFGGIGPLVFSRIRPCHVEGVIFAWLSMMYWAFILFMSPRLLGTPSMWNERLSYWSGWVWNAAMLLGFIGILTAHTQGREYAEFIWPIDIVILAVFVANIVNMVKTVQIRRVRPLYVSIWWAIGAPIWVSASIAIENVIWKPGNIWSNPSGALATGVHDAMLNWWGNHNLFGLWLTPILIAAVYYFVPRMTNTPLYSHTLSLISFWSLVFFYTTVGDHHLLQTPTPGWLKTIATINSIGILVSVWAFFGNIWLTMRGQWDRFLTNLPLRFVLVGFFMYILANVQGALQATQPFNVMTHFTYFVIGHSHLALLGGFTILGMGVVYYIVPIILNKPPYSRSIAELQFWLVTVGFLAFLLSLIVGGFLQGQGWLSGIPEVNILPSLYAWNIMRAVAGAMIYTSAWLQIVNVGLTIWVDTRARQQRVAERDARTALGTSTPAVQPPRPEPAS
jgi:cytochrome c oxidase cbb3-type subunit I